MVVIMMLLLSLQVGLAYSFDGTHTKPINDVNRKQSAGEPRNPALAERREMVRKQQEQRITPEKRKAAAERLKAERLKVYNAKQAVKKSAPDATDNK